MTENRRSDQLLLSTVLTVLADILYIPNDSFVATQLFVSTDYSHQILHIQVH